MANAFNIFLVDAASHFAAGLVCEPPPIAANITLMFSKLEARIFIFISAAIFVVDGLFIYINYVSLKEEMDHELLSRGQQHLDSFNQHLNSAYVMMLQLGTYVQNDSQVEQHFQKGRNAVLKGDKKTAALHREQLYERVKNSWLSLQESFYVRQLHFHIGPGDISFLRVHSPAKFGDDLSKIRHIIVDTINSGKQNYGFESGRLYSGIRGVVPLLDKNQQTIGALEAGTSFDLLLKDLKNTTPRQLCCSH